MGEQATAKLVIDALNMAVHNRRPNAGTVRHSDHGFQYTALAFGKAAREANLVTSMGTVYNRRCRQSALGYLSPDEFERRRSAQKRTHP